MELAKGDRVIAMSILDHVELAIEERDAFLRYDSARRRQDGVENGPEAEPDDGAAALDPAEPADAAIRSAREQLGANRLAELDAHQQLILSVTENGYGKRTSAYEYRVTNRGGQGIINILTSRRNGPVVAAFAVAEDDQLMLVTDRGQVIRIPVDGIRIAGRNTQGVTLFDVAEGEHVVSVARLAAAAEANGDLDAAGEADRGDSDGGLDGAAAGGDETEDGAREASDGAPGDGREPGDADEPGEVE
jgi:DNA gyrase subunit A